jgi:hypothetical protein
MSEKVNNLPAPASVVEYGDGTAPDSLPGDAPVGSPLYHALQQPMLAVPVYFGPNPDPIFKDGLLRILKRISKRYRRMCLLFVY